MLSFIFYNYILHFTLQYIARINKCKRYLVIISRCQLYIKALLSYNLKMDLMKAETCSCCVLLSNYEGWNFNSGNYLFTTDTK